MKLKTILFAGLCFLMLTHASQAGCRVPFIASFHGFAEPATPTDDPNVIEVVVPLRGVGTHIGKFRERLVHHINTQDFSFTGYADWTAANGDTFRTVFEGHLIPTDDPNVVTFEVTHTIVSGTGRFRRATGTFKGINGLYNFATGEDQGGYIGFISF